MSPEAPIGSSSPAADATRPGAAPGQRDDPIRVAFCIDNMNVGGTELNAVRSAPLLQELGVDLRVFTPATGGPLLDRYAAAGVPVHHLPMSSLHGLTALRAGRRMRQLIREHDVQIVHAHDFYSNIFAGPHARLAGARFIASRRWWEGPDRRMQRWANRASYMLADRVLANAPTVAELLVRQELVRAARVAVVPNFLDAEAFDPPPAGWRAAQRARWGIPEDALVIGAVANLSPVKDHAVLLDAFALLAREYAALHLVLIGADGGSRESLLHQADRLGLGRRVHLPGHCPSLPSPHHLFDVSALASRSEGLPNSVLEAMAAGRPVVATDVGATRDAVREGETGFLVPPRQPRALADRLGRLIVDPDLRAHMGATAQHSVAVGYTAPVAMAALLRLYRDVVPGLQRAARPR